jgi:hypothetical protein
MALDLLPAGLLPMPWKKASTVPARIVLERKGMLIG